MPSTRKSRAEWRSLLTETLPYEVPVIFSNERLYAASISPPPAGPILNELEKAWAPPREGSVPYSYTIRKDRGGGTDLGIIHPVWQREIAKFYETYAQSILDYCKKSEFSLRRPTAISPPFSENALSPEETLKVGIPHVLPGEGEIDIAHHSSYFVYAKFNLMHKFIESDEFLRLEKRFSRMRMLDISKCFFNIYTHTVTWSVKSKEIAKKYRNSYSFEGRFDTLMQKANYNETNGIVVGPEISRIFAEIIFQEIDRRVFNALEHHFGGSKDSPAHGRVYGVRRYVDDYFVFTNSDSDLDAVEERISRELQEYKLFINAHKTSTQGRPFVSAISLARNEIRDSLSQLPDLFVAVASTDDASQLRPLNRKIRDRVKAIRLAVATHGVGFHTISGWLLISLRATVRRVLAACGPATTADQYEGVTDALLALLDVAFYVCALDLRVRTTFSICQLVAALDPFSKKADSDSADRINHKISEELRSLIRTANSKKRQAPGPGESVELYNLLICGANFLGEDFVRCDAAQEALESITSDGPLRYFEYVTAKFCYLRNASTFSDRLAQLNASAIGRLNEPGFGISEHAEAYLLFADLMSAPDLSDSQKGQVFRSLLGGTASNATVAATSAYLGFVDWTGLQIEHLLARRELRPVYAWS